MVRQVLIVGVYSPFLSSCSPIHPIINATTKSTSAPFTALPFSNPCHFFMHFRQQIAVACCAVNSLGNQHTVNRIGGMKRIRSSVLDVLTGVLINRQDVFSANADYCFVIFSVTSWGSASPATTWIP